MKSQCARASYAESKVHIDGNIITPALIGIACPGTAAVGTKRKRERFDG